MTREEIASIIKSMRINSGLTQKQIAEKLGKKQQTIASWESGQSQPDANTLFAFCSLCGTTVDIAFGFTQQKNSPTPAEPEVGDSDYDALDGYGLSQHDYDLIYTFLVDLGVLSKGQDITRDQIGVLSGVLRILRSTFSPSDIGSKKDKAV